MLFNIQGLELLCKISCLKEGSLHLVSQFTLKHNRYEILPNLSCSNVSFCLIGAVSLRICWGFFLTDITLHSWSKILTKKSSKQQWNIHSCVLTFPQVLLRKFATLGIFFVLKMPYRLPLLSCLYSKLWVNETNEVQRCWWKFEDLHICSGALSCGGSLPFSVSPSTFVLPPRQHLDPLAFAVSKTDFFSPF